MCLNIYIFVVAPHSGTTLETTVSFTVLVCQCVCGHLSNLTCSQISRHTRLLKLSGLILMGPMDISIFDLIRRTMLGPCLSHIRAMFWPFLLYLCFQMLEMAQIFTGRTCMPNRRIQFDVKLLGPYNSHVGAMFGPYQGHVLTISTISLLLDA